MPRTAKPLSSLTISRLTGPKRHAVGAVVGLYLWVSETGARSWIYRVSIGTKRREIGLGSYPLVGLADAKRKALEYFEAVQAGRDPQIDRQEARSRLLAAQSLEKTFDQCVQGYIEAHGNGWKNPKHRQQWVNTLTDYASPIVGRLLVQHINKHHILMILTPIWEDKTETAVRLRGRIEKVLDWATVRGYRDGENPARWKGNLEMLLAAPSKIAKTAHFRALPFAQLPPFVAKLRKLDGAATMLLFLILTAVRSGDVRQARKGQFNLKKAEWTIPETKTGEPHTVPLSKQALQIVKECCKQLKDDNDLIFPSPTGKMYTDMALTELIRRMGYADTTTAHGFRSTFRDWVSETTDYPRDLAEMALAHKVSDKVEAAYRRGKMLERRRPMMQAWADFACG